MPWLQLSLETTEDQAPLLELLFVSLGALSITLGDAGDQPLLEPAPGEELIWRKTRIIGLFEATRDTDELRTVINQALNSDVTRSLKIEPLHDQAWERAWLDHYHAMQFGQRLWVGPEEQLPDAANAVLVKLDPGLAFGTGTHPTTALCLEWLEGLDLCGKTIIDFGCGSGILAIAALQLGAAKAIAVDYDPQALEATEENAKRNGVSARLSTYLPQACPAQPAEVLVANILAGPLIELAPRLCELLKPTGWFALSGILTEQTESVIFSYADCARFKRPKELDGWILLSGEKKP